MKEKETIQSLMSENEDKEKNCGSSNQDVSKRKWYSIDTSMIVPKMAFACSSATFSCIEGYLLLILISVGLDPVDAGLVGGLRFIGGFIGGNIWGLIADHKKCHRLVLFIACSGALFSMGAQPFLIFWLGTNSGNTCSVTNSSLLSGNSTVEKGNVSGNINERHLFYAMLIVNTIVNFFDSAHKGFIDSGVIERCRINPRNPNFGFQRMFGSAGYATGILAANIFVDNFPKASVSCYTAVFIVYMIFTVALLILTQILFRGLTFESEEQKEQKKVNAWKLLMKTLDGHVCLFLVTVLMMGIQQSFYINFTFLLLKEINAASIIYGLNIAVGSVSSASFFFAGRYIIEKIGGTWPAMITGIFAYFFRFLAIAFTKNPWFIPLIQTLQSFCFGLFLTAAVLHIKRIALPEIRTTLYSIMNSLHFGVGIIIANILGGKLYKEYGGKKLFLAASMAALIWAIIVTLYFFIFVKFKIFNRYFSKVNNKLKIELT